MSPTNFLLPPDRELAITDLALTENSLVVLAASTAAEGIRPADR